MLFRSHRGKSDTIQVTGEAIANALQAFSGVSGEVLRTQRREKFLAIGRGAVT